MIRFITRWCALGLVVCGVASPARAQAVRSAIQSTAYGPTAAVGELRGVVENERGEALPGAVVSALGRTTLFAMSDASGHFVFRSLTPGPYLIRAHLQGYAPGRARVIQVNSTQRPLYVLSLTRAEAASDAPSVLAAGIGGVQPSPPSVEGGDDHDELAWRLRHAKRSVLKDAQQAAAELGDESAVGDSLHRLGRAVGTSARLASFLSDLPVNGQIDLLTTTAFDRPQDLFAMDAAAPRAVAYVSLVVPGQTGEWLMRGTITQGDLASWIVSGSYRRLATAAHSYEAGLSYSTQRYLGGNSEALLAMRDGSRNVGSVYAHDNWAVSSRVRLGYGAEYAKYDYLETPTLLSPRASVTIQPVADDALKLRALISHRETAPGAREFTPSSTGLWLPPERTFSHISRGVFQPERLDHIEVGAQREWSGLIVVGVRAFHQRVDDQVVTLFGVSVPDSPRGVGHYRVGSAGDFWAEGWGVSVSRALVDGIHASLDYTQADTHWYGRAPDGIALAAAAPGALHSSERIRDVTATVDTVLAPSATRVFLLYKINSGLAGAGDALLGSVTNARFSVQVNQSLPFLNFTNAHWEMLVAVSNLFSDDPIDGSVYDELLVIQPPKRMLGGVTVRF